VVVLDVDVFAWLAGFVVLAATLAYAIRHLSEMPRLAAYIELVRPFTLIAPIIAGACFGLMGEASTGWVHWSTNPAQFVITMIWGVGALVLVNAASNAINAVYDVDIDRINKPNRPLPRGAINPQEATTIAYFLYLLTIFRASFLNPAFTVFVFAIMLLTIAYSAPPFRLKKHFMLNNASIALARGQFGVLASWCIFGSPFDSVPWAIGFIMFVFLFGAATTKDFTDIPGDRAYGMRTLPIVIGVERAATITAAFFIIPIAVIPITVSFLLLPASANYLIILGVWGAYVFRHTKDWTLTRDPLFENNPMWRQMYLLLMALAVGFSVTYMLL
jgi:4-hydroxybenzoate polyprenyltransferase